MFRRKRASAHAVSYPTFLNRVALEFVLHQVTISRPPRLYPFSLQTYHPVTDASVAWHLALKSQSITLCPDSRCPGLQSLPSQCHNIYSRCGSSPSQTYSYPHLCREHPDKTHAAEAIVRRQCKRKSGSTAHSKWMSTSE